jgi:hypothetical protein
VETDLLLRSSLADDDRARIAASARYATLSGVLVAETGSPRLACVICVGASGPSRLRRLLGTAAALQIAEAEILLDANFPEPSRGGRSPEAGEGALDPIWAAIGVRGEGGSLYEDSAEIEEARMALARTGACLPTRDAFGLSVEIPFGPRAGYAMRGGESLLLQVSSMDPHPRLGHGLAMRLHLPFALNGEAQSRLALRLNALEQSSRPDVDLLGSWCPDSGPGPMFVSFLPNAVYEQGLLEDRVLAMMARARWLGEIYEREGFGGDAPTASA